MSRAKIKWIVGALCVAVLSTSAGIGVKAYFTSEKKVESEYKIVKIDTEIDEDLNTDGTKTVTVKNVGTAACYVRARVKLSPSDLDEYLTLTGVNDSDWILNVDGYYYYKKILVPQGYAIPASWDRNDYSVFTTTPLFTGYEFKEDALLALKGTEFDISIYEESAQVLFDSKGNMIAPANGKLADAWNRYNR